MMHTDHSQAPGGSALTRTAISATLHCLTGCAIGEILGMILGTALGWTALPTVVLSVVLAFAFGYSLTIRPVLRSGLALAAAVPVALAADTVSITVMEIVDNAVMLLVPGALNAGLSNPLFWMSLLASLAVAFVITVPVNRALIARGKGHAVVHQYHHAGHADAAEHRQHDGAHADPDHASHRSHP
jgi:uncharacterized protein DUF4396